MEKSITQLLEDILTAVYGKDVRKSIHDAILKSYEDATKEGNANMEVSQARGIYTTLTERLAADLSNTIEKINDGDSRLRTLIDSVVSGSPLVASSTSEMIDTTRVYVNTTDGHWYWYDGNSWQDGGVYQATGVIYDNTLADNEKSTPAYETGYYINNYFKLQNLFNNNAEDIDYGKYIEVTGNKIGTLTENFNYLVSGKIYCVPRQKLLFPVYDLYGAIKKYVCGFNSSDEPIRIEGTVDENNIIEIEIPENVSYFRVTLHKNDLYSFMIIKKIFNCIYPTNYIPYSEKLELNNKLKYEEVNFITNESQNVYDNNSQEIILDKRITYNDTLADDNDFLVSGFIPVEYGKTYIFPCYPYVFGTSSQLKAINGYRKNKTWVANINATLDTTNRFLILSINNGDVHYIRVNVYNGSNVSNKISSVYSLKNNFMVWKGEEYPLTKFYPYNELLTSEIVSNYNEIDNSLLFKKIVFLGDSICQGSSAGNYDGYAGFIGNHNKMLWRNLGNSGATISTASGKVICQTTIDVDNPDFIILEGGTNDADRIGNATGSVKPEKFGTYNISNFGTDDEETHYGFDISTFCGAMEFMIKRIVTNYPSAKVGYIVAHKMGMNSNGYTPEVNNRAYYFETAKNICEKWGIPVLDLWNNCKLNPMLKAFYDSSSQEELYYTDSQHLTTKGYEIISPIIENWMKGL